MHGIDSNLKERFVISLLNSISELGVAFTTSTKNEIIVEKSLELLSFQRSPIVWIIFLSLLLASNICTFILRIYKNSITSANTNIIIIINSYIYELYNLLVTSMVSNTFGNYLNKMLFSSTLKI